MSMSCHCPTDFPPYRHSRDCGYYEPPSPLAPLGADALRRRASRMEREAGPLEARALTLRADARILRERADEATA